MSPEEEVAQELCATRTAFAIVLKRLAAIEAKVDAVTSSRDQHWEEEKARRREATWE